MTAYANAYRHARTCSSDSSVAFASSRCAMRVAADSDPARAASSSCTRRCRRHGALGHAHRRARRARTCTRPPHANAYRHARARTCSSALSSATSACSAPWCSSGLGAADGGMHSRIGAAERGEGTGLRDRNHAAEGSSSHFARSAAPMRECIPPSAPAAGHSHGAAPSPSSSESFVQTDARRGGSPRTRAQEPALPTHAGRGVTAAAVARARWANGGGGGGPTARPRRPAPSWRASGAGVKYTVTCLAVIASVLRRVGTLGIRAAACSPQAHTTVSSCHTST